MPDGSPAPSAGRRKTGMPPDRMSGFPPMGGMRAACYKKRVNPETSAAGLVDLLLELELRIARRADELTGIQGVAGSLNLHCWLVAEHEVLSRENPLASK